MSLHLYALSVDANDPPVLARFWAGVLGWETVDDPVEGVAILPSDDTGFRIRFPLTEAPKTGLNQTHLHLTSATADAQPRTVARVLELGGHHLDLGQLPEEGHIVLADPEGNEFCVIEAGNNFLADCGFLGELSFDGTRAVGHFWSEALGWPLVWDQDEETAIRSPHGGPKLSWGGPPVRPKVRKNRMHLDLAPPLGGDQQGEVERLVSLGATHIDIGQRLHEMNEQVVLADTDGNEFCVLTPR